MHVKAIKRTLVVSAPLVLLLLAVTMMPQHTGATSSSSAGVCLSETEACTNEAECYECLVGWAEADGGADAFTECGETFLENRSGNYDGTDVCSAAAMSACCQDALASVDCMGNAAFLEYHTCFLNYASDAAGQEGCTTFSCPDGIGGEALNDTDDAGGDDAGGADDDDAGEVDGGADDADADDDVGAADDDAATADRGMDDDADQVTGGAADDAEDAESVPTPVATACDDEYFACADDDECNECVTNWGAADGAEEAYAECIGNQVYDQEDACALSSIGACCIDSVSSNNSLANSAFVGFWMCAVNEYAECTAITCDGATFDIEGNSGVVAKSPPSALLTIFLGLLFLAASPLPMAVFH